LASCVNVSTGRLQGMNWIIWILLIVLIVAVILYFVRRTP
jgi:Mg2+ and Co2+ transporter CorA